MPKRKTLYLHEMTYIDVAEYLKRCDVIFEHSAAHLAAFLEEVKKFPIKATNREFNNRA